MYVKNKRGEFVALKPEAIAKLTKRSEIKNLRESSRALAGNMRALTLWLLAIQRQSMRMNSSDLTVSRLPNLERLINLTDKVNDDLGAF